MANSMTEGREGDMTMRTDVCSAGHQDLESAQGAVLSRMGVCAGLWFVPFASGIACNLVELKLIGEVFSRLGRTCSDAECTDLFWFFRGKTLFLNLGTYAPVCGTALQVIEVYLLGQLAIHAAVRTDHFDQHAMEREWTEIETQILSGARLVLAMEEFTGGSFPQEFRIQLESATDWFS